MDTGVDATHPHFSQYGNLSNNLSKDFSNSNLPGAEDPLKDRNGHGTHVAGIIAGAFKSDDGKPPQALLKSGGGTTT